MYIQTQQPKPRCSKCGSISFHEFQNESIDFGTMTKKIEYHIQCNICKHGSITSTMWSTYSLEPTVYQLPNEPQPEFKDF